MAESALSKRPFSKYGCLLSGNGVVPIKTNKLGLSKHQPSIMCDKKVAQICWSRGESGLRSIVPTTPEVRSNARHNELERKKQKRTNKEPQLERKKPFFDARFFCTHKTTTSSNCNIPKGSQFRNKNNSSSSKRYFTLHLSNYVINNDVC